MTGQALVKTFEVTDLPGRPALTIVRACKFIARKNWIVAGADDLTMRVVNYNTQEKVARFDAHTDYIRSLAVHPTKPFVLSSSDDMTIKLWDWEKGWKSVMTFEGHFHYVMSVAFNPKDSNTFVSGSLDRTIKVFAFNLWFLRHIEQIWNIGSSTANFTLEGHEKGVNCVDYYIGADRPYIASGADDRTIKIWDYQNKSCVQTLEGHTQNVSSVCFHPELPIILSGSEDGTVKMWQSTSFKLSATLSYGFERIWAIAYRKGFNEVAFGCDEGTIVIGREEPAASMDSSGKVIWAKHNEIQTVSVKVPGESKPIDGEKLSLPIKELGNCEVYPQTLKHSPSGRFVVVCGDSEYIIYTALAWRNKDFGKALDFVWGTNGNDYAIRESPSNIYIFKNFKKEHSVKPISPCDCLFGGALLGLRCYNFLCFYDWNTQQLVRRIDVTPIIWSDNGRSVAILCKDSFYILRYESSALSSYLEQEIEIPADGVEEAFTLVEEVSESVQSGTWIADCFIYTTSNRLCYFIGDKSYVISHLSSPCFILGYVPKDSRIYLIDRDHSIVSYELDLMVIEYETCILLGEFEKAQSVLSKIGEEQKTKLAKFLEAQGRFR